MPLYVRSEGVNRLAKEAQAALGAPSKSEAIRIALQRVLEQESGRQPLRTRLIALQKNTLALGAADQDFDEKAFSDEMWGS